MRAFINADGSRPTAVVFGEGLIGRALCQRLRRAPHTFEAHSPTDWDNPASVGADIASALATAGPLASVHVIWAAGQSGMTTEAQPATAIDKFHVAISSAVDATQRFGPVTIHLVSSAGALGSPHSPSRFELPDSPYKSIMTGQETALMSLHDSVRIHRASSVYGAPLGASRSGIIGRVVANSLLGFETPLFARTSTMRNYIHAADLADALYRSLDDGERTPTLLAAHRSHAMTEVIATIRNVLRRPVPVSFRPFANDHDMVFNPKDVSRLVPQRPLAAGVRLTFDSILSR